MGFLDELKAIKAQADSGELKGYAIWPLKGDAKVIKVSETYKVGKPYLSFTLANNKHGTTDFLVRVPLASDKDAAKILGLQRIYSTLFTIAGADITKHDPAQAIEMARKRLPVDVSYSLQEYEQVSQKNGQTYKNQSLESLDVIGNDLDWGV